MKLPISLERSLLLLVTRVKGRIPTTNTSRATSKAGTRKRDYPSRELPYMSFESQLWLRPRLQILLVQLFFPLQPPQPHQFQILSLHLISQLHNPPALHTLLVLRILDLCLLKLKTIQLFLYLVYVHGDQIGHFLLHFGLLLLEGVDDGCDQLADARQNLAQLLVNHQSKEVFSETQWQ